MPLRRHAQTPVAYLSKDTPPDLPSKTWFGAGQCRDDQREKIALFLIYSASAQNLMMSILFIAMLVRRNSVDGQSMYIAIFKWLGTLAPTIQFYRQTCSHFYLALGGGCFVYDMIYMGMLDLKFREMKLNPFTRKMLPNAKYLYSPLQQEMI